MARRALLYFSFGGPDGPDDVLPFMQNVTRKRPVPPERLVEVSRHYHLFGGRSPINSINLELIERIRPALVAAGHELPVYFGNRNWSPYLGEALGQMGKDGIEEALVFVTSAYGSYSGCRQYRDDLAEALADPANPPIRLWKLRHFYDHPRFVEPFAQGATEAFRRLAVVHGADGVSVLYTAHSIPTAMASNSEYLAQLGLVRDYVNARLAKETGRQPVWAQVFQSRSGPPSQPWLEPDISDAMNGMHVDGADAFVVIPIGFISDHMEVVYDLDTLAASTARDLGAGFMRVPTPSSSPGFEDLVVDLVREQEEPGFVAPSLPMPLKPLRECRPGCCMPGYMPRSL